MSLQRTGEHHIPIDADVVPSIGVDISNLPLDKTKTVQIKEVGGAMMPLWPTYLKGAAALMYVVDISDAYQLAASATAFRRSEKSPPRATRSAGANRSSTMPNS